MKCQAQDHKSRGWWSLGPQPLSKLYHHPISTRIPVNKIGVVEGDTQRALCLAPHSPPSTTQDWVRARSPNPGRFGQLNCTYEGIKIEPEDPGT